MDYVALVTTEQPYVWPSATGETHYKIALLDCGVKFNILRSLAALGAEITVYPAHTPAETILATNPDGIFLSPGPGDPALAGRHRADCARSVSGQADHGHLSGKPTASAARSAGIRSNCRSAIAAPTIP